MGRYQGFKFQKLIATRVPVVHAMSEAENEQKHAIAVAAATTAAANAMAMAAQATATMIQLTPASMGRPSVVEEATNKIQAVFGFYLARKALCAWKGLVKLQALVKGHMVRKEATATNGCMQALVPVQARARAQRIRLAAEAQPITIGN